MKPVSQPNLLLLSSEQSHSDRHYLIAKENEEITQVLLELGVRCSCGMWICLRMRKVKEIREFAVFYLFIPFIVRRTPWVLRCDYRGNPNDSDLARCARLPSPGTMISSDRTMNSTRNGLERRTHEGQHLRVRSAKQPLVCHNS